MVDVGRMEDVERMVAVGRGGGKTGGGAPMEGMDRLSVVVKRAPVRVVCTCQTDSNSCQIHIHMTNRYNYMYTD